MGEQIQKMAELQQKCQLEMETVRTEERKLVNPLCR